jgi:predicted ATPase
MEEARLQQVLASLVEAEVLYQRGLPPQAHYVFKHALIQDAAYVSLLKRTRRRYHQQIAQVLAARCPELAETQPELLAHHYTEAGLSEQAVGYWLRAGERSHARSAYAEAVAHCTKGLAVLQTLPDTPARARQELNMQVALCRALRVTKGMAAPEVEAIYHRARELCQQVGETRQLLEVLGGLVPFYTRRRDLQTARELVEQMRSLAQCVHDPAGVRNAHIMLGRALAFCGDADAIHTYLGHDLTLYMPEQLLSPGPLNIIPLGVFGFARLATDLWSLGYPDQALQRSQAALTLARERAHPVSLAAALIFAAILHCLRREAHLTYEHAETAFMLAREQGFAERMAEATILQGWALVKQGQGEAGIAQIRQALAARRATEAKMSGFYRALLVEASRNVGQVEEGLQMIAQVLAIRRNSREGRLAAELSRLKGELLLTRSAEHQAEAETCFRQALEMHRRRGTKSLELRAAMSLSHLWQQQGKRHEAHQLLAEVYGWFTEGFDTADLQEARALLEALG